MSTYEKLVVIVGAFFLLVLYGFIFWLICAFVRNERKIRKLKKMLSVQEDANTYYKLAQEQIDETNRLKEELRNQITSFHLAIKEGKKEKGQDIFKEIENTVERIPIASYCSDSLINTILSIKKERAKKQGITMHIKVDSFVPVNISDADVCSLLTNLLDNAIEAVANTKTEKEQETEVTVHIGQRAGYLLIRVENPIEKKKIRILDGRLLSTKSKDAGMQFHGRGVRIMEGIVNRGGDWYFTEKDGRIAVTVFLREKSRELVNN